MSRSDERTEMLRLGLSVLSKDILAGSSFSDALMKLLENVLQIYQADGAYLSLDGVSPSGRTRLAIGCCRTEEVSDEARWDPRTGSFLVVEVWHRKSEIGRLGLGKLDRKGFFKRIQITELQTFTGYLGPLFDNVKARDQALAGMANGVLHDFNNVLQTVISGLSLIKTLAPQETLTPILGTMERAAGHGREVVNEIRNFLGEKPEPTDEIWLNDLLLEVLPLAEAKARAHPGKTITFEDRLAATGPIRASRSQMKRIILNLLFNAIDAIHQTGAISVESRSDHETISVVVTDTGAGIKEEDLPRIFEPFFSTKGPSHSGLGLSSIYGIVKRNGGTIDVTSTPGKGTAFTISLPTSGGRVSRPSERE